MSRDDAFRKVAPQTRTIRAVSASTEGITMNAKPATPLPWMIAEQGDFAEYGQCAIEGNRAEFVARVWSGSIAKQEAADANAAYIVHACNSLPRLEAELAELRALQVNGFDPIAAARAYPQLVSFIRTLKDHGDATRGDELLRQLGEIK